MIMDCNKILQTITEFELPNSPNVTEYRGRNNNVKI